MDIKRYRIEAECRVVLINDDGVSVFGDIITDYKNKSWCKYSDVEKLLARIEELENEKKNVNEIKAQGIEEAIHHANGATYIYPQGGDVLVQQYRAELRHYADKLRKSMTDFESVKYHSNGIDYYKFENGLTAWVITEREQDHPVREVGLKYSGPDGTGWRELIAIEPLSDSELNTWLKFISKVKPGDISKDD